MPISNAITTMMPNQMRSQSSAMAIGITTGMVKTSIAIDSRNMPRNI